MPLTPIDWKTLVAIAELGKDTLAAAILLKDVARAMGYSNQAGVTRSIRRLQAAGLIEHTRGLPGLRLTREALTLLDALRAVNQAAQKRASK